MKTSDRMFDKQEYNSPEIASVELDVAISLALESEPPIGPGEDLLGSLQRVPFEIG
jgi:hypothetical protein